MQTIQIRLTKELVKKAQDLVDEGLYSNKSEVVRDSLRRLVFENKLVTNNQRDFKILFTSDVHGNISQYKKLFQRAEESKAGAVIIGGDIAPKDPDHRTIESQKEFIEKQLIPLISAFKEKNSADVFIMLGNDDFKSNEKILEKYEKKAGYKIINQKCIRLHEGFKIIGYNFVPLTPFKYKDWEKLDLNTEEESVKRKGFLVEGVKIKNNKFIKKSFDMKRRKNTIERDLSKLFKCADHNKIIFVSHSPPYETNLDLLKNNQHVGSAAIRRIIEEKQPYLTLHGHVHETVEVSGDFMEKIGKTISMAAGNDNLNANLAIIEFNLYKSEEAKRVIV
jgi:Icc-related predicted phosphoesterase